MSDQRDGFFIPLPATFDIQYPEVNNHPYSSDFPVCVRVSASVCVQILLESYLMDHHAIATKLKFLEAQIQSSEALVRAIALYVIFILLSHCINR